MTEFTVKLTHEAAQTLDALRVAAKASLANRQKNKKSKASKQEGLFKQVSKTLAFLTNPRHPGLHSHEFDSLANPFDQRGTVFEAYVQNNTPGAFRVFWCYGPGAGEITVIAITEHP